MSRTRSNLPNIRPSTCIPIVCTFHNFVPINNSMQSCYSVYPSSWLKWTRCLTMTTSNCAGSHYYYWPQFHSYSNQGCLLMLIQPVGNMVLQQRKLISLMKLFFCHAYCICLINQCYTYSISRLLHVLFLSRPCLRKINFSWHQTGKDSGFLLKSPKLLWVYAEMGE